MDRLIFEGVPLLGRLFFRFLDFGFASARNDRGWSVWGWWRSGEKSFEGIFSARENFFLLRDGLSA